MQKQCNRIERREVLCPELFLFNKLDLKPNELFLDVGCGNGFYLIQAAKKKTIAFAFDKSKEAIKKSRSRVNAFYIVADAVQFPFKNTVFDKISCMSIIEHVVQQKKFVKEVHRVLKFGGTAIFYTPNKKNFFTIDWFKKKLFKKRYLEYLQESNHNPELFFSPKELIQLLSKNGFFVDKLIYSNGLFHELFFEIMQRKAVEKSKNRVAKNLGDKKLNLVIALYNAIVFPILYAIALFDKIPALFGFSSDFAVIAKKVKQ